MPKSRKKSEETNEVSEADSDMTQMLESSEQEFKITKISTFRCLMKRGQHVRTGR